MHERPERIASQPAKRILQGHGEETLVERMAADDAIEGHHCRDWKLGGEVEEVTLHELSRV